MTNNKESPKSNIALNRYLDSFTREKQDDIICQNSLSLIVIKANKAHAPERLSNVFLSKLHLVELSRLQDIMTKAGLKMISFKGRLLAEQLFEESWRKLVGDIDIYVAPSHYDVAIHLLIEDGYRFYTENEYEDDHHMVFVKGIYCVELHHFFLAPKYGLHQEFLENHIICMKASNGIIFQTFNETATLLHLIYHLYMDSNSISVLYDTFKNASYSQPNRFLYRAYEIARYSEIYQDRINWVAIIDDVKKQPLNMCFRVMVLEVANIFPEVFPKEFLQLVKERVFNTTYNDILKRDLSSLFREYKGNDFRKKLGEYIERKHRDESGGELWGKKETIAIHQDVKNCSLEVSAWCDNEWSFLINTTQPYLTISDDYQYDTLSSDGVHLIVCSTNPYCYLSVFFFPKKRNGVILIDSYDDISKKIYNRHAFKPVFQRTTVGYRMELSISRTVFPELYENNHLFCDVVMAVCDPLTCQRKLSISRVKESKRWFVPSEFLKIWK